ncbi:hypothetical protein GGGNBK_05865 [Sporosarcina sp. ANT_H38]
MQWKSPTKRRNRFIDNKPLFEQKRIGAYFLLFLTVSMISAGQSNFHDMLENGLASVLEPIGYSVYSHGKEYKMGEMGVCLY